MGICSSNPVIHCDDNDIKKSIIIPNYNNPIISFKNHTICVSKLGSNPNKKNSKLILVPDYAHLIHTTPNNSCQIYYYDHNNKIKNIPPNYTQVKLYSYPKDTLIDTIVVKKEWLTCENTWCHDTYYYVDKDIVSKWEI